MEVGDGWRNTDAVRLLVPDQASTITGATLTVDRGAASAFPRQRAEGGA